MPLQSQIAPALQLAGQPALAKDVAFGTHSGPQRSATPLDLAGKERARRDSDTSNASEHLISAPPFTQIINRQHAASLKFDLQSGLGRTGAYSNSGDPLQPLVSTYRPASIKPKSQYAREQEASKIRKSTFDETQSFRDDDTPSDVEENQTTVFRTEAIQGQSGRQPFDSGNHMAFDAEHVSRSLSSGWDRGSTAQRRALEQSGNLRVSDWATEDERIYTNEYQSVDNQQILQDTPTRSNTLLPSFTKPTMTQTKVVTFSESPMLGSRDLERQVSPDIPLPRSSRTARGSSNRLSTHSTFLGKQKDQSEVVTGSSGLDKPTSSNPVRTQQQHAVGTLNDPVHDPLPQPESPVSSDTDLSRPVPVSTPNNNHLENRKRPRKNELDYEMDVLKSLTFKQLDQEDFNQEPPSTQTAQPQGADLALSQRLEKLDQMDEQGQRDMFRTQTDIDWGETGSWFIEKFQADLKRLMAVRCERRKISMRYEQEIRKRQAEIERCIDGVEDELKGLKKGGGLLIEGRKLSVRSTPPRVE